MAIKKTFKPRRASYTPSPDIVDVALQQCGWKTGLDPERQDTIRFAAAEVLLNGYHRMMRDMPDSVRRNASLNSAMDRSAKALAGKEGLIPSPDYVPTKAERDFVTERFPGNEYNKGYNASHRP